MRRNYLVIDDVDNNPVLDCVYDLVEHLVHFHTFGCVVVAEPEAHYAGLFAELERVRVMKMPRVSRRKSTAEEI